MITDNFQVIADQGRIVFGILLLIVLSQTLITKVLRIIFGDQLTTTEYIFLGMAGWILPASLLSMLWIYTGFGILIVLLIIPFLPRLQLDPSTLPSVAGQRLEPASKKIAFSLLTILSLSILLRLVFVSQALLPPYFDSAQHYLLIKQFMGNDATESFTPTRYYHTGFHILTAFITSTFNGNIARTMLIIGQMILAVMPISLYFPIKHETKSNAAGIFAVILSACGWYMPAHAVNWGKYPALMSLGLIPFVLSLAYLLARNKNVLPSNKLRILYVMLAISILVTVLAHSRALVIFGIAFLAWIISAWRQRFSQWQRSLIFIGVVIVVVLEIVFIQRQTIFAPLFDPYLRTGVWITALVFFLSIFAHKVYPQAAFACIVAICLLLVSLFIPVTGFIPGYGDLTLLDRPFVEMTLFLPLSLLGGLGLAGLEKSLRHAQIKRVSQNGVVVIFAGAFIVVNAFSTITLHPSACCVIAGNDDVAAIDWMDTHLPSDARIGISTTALKVFASESFEGYAGGDAGTWITPLTGRVTVPLLHDLDFNRQAVLDLLCQTDVSHLYVGEIGQTFDHARLSNRPEWYKLILSMPRVKVYEVVRCK